MLIEPGKMALTASEHQAISEFLASVSVPIVRDRLVYGTGTLFEVAGVHFVVTAAHVVRDMEARGLQVPVDEGGIVLHSLKGTDVVLHERVAPAPDCAAIRLDANAVQALRHRRRFLTLDRVLSAEPRPGVPLLVCGFPSEVTPEGLGPPRTFITTVLERQVSEFLCHDLDGELVASNAEIHLFLKHSDEVAELATGQEGKSPRLHGMSGCSVWGFVLPTRHRIWLPPPRPQDTVRVIAVQSSYVHGRWIRTTYWAHVLQMIRRALPETRLQIDAVLADWVRAEGGGSAPAT